MTTPAPDLHVPTLLVTVTGPDRPGVTWDVVEALTVPGVSVLDVEQVVVRGNLTLAVLVTQELPRVPSGRRCTPPAPGSGSASTHTGRPRSPGMRSTRRRRKGRVSSRDARWSRRPSAGRT
ncbi:MAG: ACT domain-containing protein [Kineosporiaceae bacterium]